MPTEDYDAAVRRKRKEWLCYYRFWQLLSWILLIFIGCGSVFVASSLSASFGIKEWVAIVVAAASALFTTLQPQARAQAMRQAHIRIDLAIKQQDGCPEEILEALRDAEGYIEAGYFPKERRPGGPSLP